MSTSLIKKIIQKLNLENTTTEMVPFTFQIHDYFEMNYKEESKIIKIKQSESNKNLLNQIKKEKKKLQNDLDREEKEISYLDKKNKDHKKLIKSKQTKIDQLKFKIKQIDNKITNTEKSKDITALAVQYFQVYLSRNEKIKKLFNNQIDIQEIAFLSNQKQTYRICLLYTSPSPRDLSTSRMPSSA